MSVYFYMLFFFLSLKQIDYVSSLTCPEPNYLSNEVKILKWTGFFTLKNAKKLLNAMLDMNLEVEHHSPLQHSWLNLTLHGFDDIHTGLCTLCLITYFCLMVLHYINFLCS